MLRVARDPTQQRIGSSSIAQNKASSPSHRCCRAPFGQRIFLDALYNSHAETTSSREKAYAVCLATALRTIVSMNTGSSRLEYLSAYLSIKSSKNPSRSAGFKASESLAISAISAEQLFWSCFIFRVARDPTEASQNRSSARTNGSVAQSSVT